MRPLALALLSSFLCAQAPTEPARVQVFEVFPKAVKAGDSVELRWSVTGTERVQLEPLDQYFPPVGHATYAPRERTVFWLHASNARGGQSAPLVVEMLPETATLSPAPVDRPAGVQSDSSGIWIQLAALADQGRVERLSDEVMRLTGAKVTLFEIEAEGQTLHRLRLGPYATVREARTRLKTLQGKLRSLHLQPIVAVN